MNHLLALTIPAIDPSGAPVQIKAPDGIPTGSQYSITNLASGFLSVLMVIGVILSLMYLLYGGFFWIQSKGDKTKLDKARRIILYSILGLIMMSLALVVVNVISQAIGIKSATQ